MMKILLVACLAFDALAGTMKTEEGEVPRGDAAAAGDRMQKIHSRFSADCFNKCRTLSTKQIARRRISRI